MRGAGLRSPGRPVVIAAGGTGGHFFPAEALAAELVARGHVVALMTDARGGAGSSAVFQGREVIVLRGAGLAGRGRRAVGAAMALAAGTAAARGHLQRLNPAVLVGFGGYPCVAPVLATRTLRRGPAVLLHEQNAVLGRANRVLSRFADQLLLGMDSTQRLPATPHTVVGNPVRPAILAAAKPYAPPSGTIELLVTGGSQGARAFAAVPGAIALLPTALRGRLHVTQQCRAEDLDGVRAAYAALGVPATLSPFFADMAGLLASAHLVLARAGASTVAELCAMGRPAVLVPLPGAIDGHQLANARASGATVLEQSAWERDPAALAHALTTALDPAALVTTAARLAAHARPDAAQRLADHIELHIDLHMEHAGEPHRMPA